MSTDAQEAITYCHVCGTSFDDEIPSDRLVSRLLEADELWRSVQSDLHGMPKHLSSQHAASLGRLSGKLEQMRRLSMRAAELADYMGRHVTR
jgi:hypothetical protein